MCIFVERFYCCPQEKDIPLPKPSKPKRSHRPWLDWKHGELITSDEVSHKSFPNHNYVRHRISSKIRCINWYAKTCDDTPHETQYLLYKSSCPDCTGSDRCITSKDPYIKYRHAHNKTIKTEKDHERLNAALASYWQYLMRIQTSIMRYTIGDFYSQELLFDNIDVHDQDVFHFFASMACTQNAEHINKDEAMVPEHCEACACTSMAPGHNLLRNLLLRESRAAWSNGGDDFFERVDTLEREGQLDYLRETRRQESHVSQDWFKEDFMGGEKDLKTSRKTIDKICKELLKIGPCVEDEDEREYDLHQSWADVVDLRRIFALRMLNLINLDPGISDMFFAELVHHHVITMLLPWPSQQTAQGPNGRLPYYPLTPIHETRNFVTSLDMYGMTLNDICQEHMHEESNLIKVLKKQRDAVYNNTLSRHKAALSYLDSLPVLSSSKASAKETCCSICGDDWQIGKLPKHMRALEMPCNSKPYHHSCLRRVLTCDEEEARCPMCRENLTESQGWFDKEYEKPLTEFPDFVRGFIPVAAHISGDGEGAGA